MQVYSFYILNKSGGLIYQKDFNIPGSPISRLNTNDYLVIAGTLHSVHAIASRITPQDALRNPRTSGNSAAAGVKPVSNKSGLSSISTGMFDIHVHQTVTGIKFILITSPISNAGSNIGTSGTVTGASATTATGIFNNNDTLTLHKMFRHIYSIYCNYVLKNPFYQLEMPIRCKLFDDKLNGAVVVMNA